MQACSVYEYGVWRTCIGHEITERVVNPCLDRTRLIWSLSCYIGVLRILRAREWKRKDREKRREKETLLNRKEYPPGGVFGGSVTFSLVDDTLLSTGRREGSTPWKTKRWRVQVGRGCMEMREERSDREHTGEQIQMTYITRASTSWCTTVTEVITLKDRGLATCATTSTGINCWRNRRQHLFLPRAYTCDVNFPSVVPLFSNCILSMQQLDSLPSLLHLFRLLYLSILFYLHFRNFC